MFAADTRTEKLAEIRRVALREAEDSLRDETLSNLANHIAETGLIIAMFGVLITVIIIFFALRTEKAAVFEARQFVEDERKKLAASHDDFLKNVRAKLQADCDAALAQITTLQNKVEEEASNRRQRLDAADASVEQQQREKMQQLDAHVETAEHHIARLALATTSPNPLSIAEQETIDTASKSASDKPSGTRSSIDVLAMIAAGIQSQRYAAVLQLAGRLETDGRTVEDQGYGAYYSGYAWFEMRQYANALDRFNAAARYLADSDSVEMRHLANKSRFNYAQALLRLCQYEDAEASFRELVATVEVEPSPESLRLLGGCHHGIAHAQDELGHTAEAVDTLRTAIDIFGDDPVVRVNANNALYDLSCALAKLDKFGEAADTLRSAVTRGLSVSRDLVARDHELDAFRISEAGMALLAELPETGNDHPELVTPNDG